MANTEQIVEYAGSLFDVAGVFKSADSESILILGLESTPERNLDEFGHIEGRFQMYGFEKHAGPLLESLLGFIQSKGHSAELVGRYGYPLFGEMNLKELAIKLGLGKRGKSTVVLHPKYGPRLRFMAVRTNAPIEPTAVSIPIDEENPACRQCSICIDICPVNVLIPYSMPDTSICLSNVTLIDKEGRSVLCDLCLLQCPEAEVK